jgi:hypothetical protein
VYIKKAEFSQPTAPVLTDLPQQQLYPALAVHIKHIPTWVTQLLQQWAYAFLKIHTSYVLISNSCISHIHNFVAI